MENLDVMVLRSLRDWRIAGKRALLATVVRTWGSSPRPVGSIMALCEDGAVVGSVSGGCIEDDLIHRFTQAYAADPARTLPAGPPESVKYGISADEAHRFGLPLAARWSCCWNLTPTHKACLAWCHSSIQAAWCNAPSGWRMAKRSFSLAAPPPIATPRTPIWSTPSGRSSACC